MGLINSYVKGEMTGPFELRIKSSLKMTYNFHHFCVFEVANKMVIAKKAAQRRHCERNFVSRGKPEKAKYAIAYEYFLNHELYLHIKHWFAAATKVASQ